MKRTEQLQTDFNDFFDKNQEAKKNQRVKLLIQKKTMRRELSKIVHLKDGTSHELCIDSAGKQYLEIGDKKILYPSQLKIEVDYEEEVLNSRMRVHVKNDDWSQLHIKFNRVFWEELRGKTFVMDEEEDGFNIEVFEPVQRTNKTFNFSKHRREIVFPSEIIDCDTDVWYNISKISETTYRVNTTKNG